MQIFGRTARCVSVAVLVSGCSGSDVTAPTISRVVFNQHSAVLYAGDVLATSVAVFKTDGTPAPNPPVTYTSSNSLVASVDNTGKVFTHTAGQATISAAIGSISDSLVVSVRWLPVTAVFFAADSLALSVGDSAAPWVSVLNSRGDWATNATLTWSSSSATVVTVDGTQPAGCPVATCSFQPRLAAIGAGRAVVTVTAERISDSLLVIVSPR